MRMLKATLTVLAAALLFNCVGENDPSISRFFHENSELDAMTLVRSNGDNIVFRWEFQHPGNDLTDIISFEIPGNETGFDHSLENGIPIPIGYTRVCDCPADTYEIVDGRISGNMNNPGEWTIIFNITVRNSEGLFLPLSDTGEYTLGN